MRRITLELVVHEKKNVDGALVKKVYRTELKITDELKLLDIVKFLDLVKVIWKKSMNAVKAENRFELEIIEAVYESYLMDKSLTLTQKSFNRWVSVPVCDQDEDGIYLQADGECTSCYRDMYLTKDLLSDLSFFLD